jgi:hypothetical protein
MALMAGSRGSRGSKRMIVVYMESKDEELVTLMQ